MHSFLEKLVSPLNLNNVFPGHVISSIKNQHLKCGIMTEELVIHEIRIDEAAGRGDSDSRMTSLCHLNSNHLKY